MGLMDKARKEESEMKKNSLLNKAQKIREESGNYNMYADSSDSSYKNEAEKKKPSKKS